MNHKNEINTEGFTIVESIYTDLEIGALIATIEKAIETKNQKITFRKSDDLFAIRQFHKEIPEIVTKVFNKNLLQFITSNFSEDYFITK